MQKGEVWRENVAMDHTSLIAYIIRASQSGQNTQKSIFAIHHNCYSCYTHCVSLSPVLCPFISRSLFAIPPFEVLGFSLNFNFICRKYITIYSNANLIVSFYNINIVQRYTQTNDKFNTTIMPRKKKKITLHSWCLRVFQRPQNILLFLIVA